MNSIKLLNVTNETNETPEPTEEALRQMQVDGDALDAIVGGVATKPENGFCGRIYWDM